ncbi:MAG: cobalt ECF transporter T component CbiQ [Firmicutes bacterium]|nr:cobalt ECF transporter T component CbiQ [Bacillota bacterium]
MNPMTGAMNELAGMDELARLSSPMHRLHPLPKLLTVLLYIGIVLSFPNTRLSGLIAMVIFPAVGYAAAGIPVRTCFYKLRYILPLILAVGIWNPILNRAPILTIGRLTVSEGMVSFLALMLKGTLSLMASFLLVATTGIEKICYALRKLRVPKLLVTMLLITYRYISLLLSEAGTMVNAYSLRAPGQKGIHISAWGSFLGQLLLRSMDRASELYQSMQMRGFTGDFYYAEKLRAVTADYLFFPLAAALFLLFRLVNVAALLGGLIV